MALLHGFPWFRCHTSTPTVFSGTVVITVQALENISNEALLGYAQTTLMLLLTIPRKTCCVYNTARSDAVVNSALNNSSLCGMEG